MSAPSDSPLATEVSRAMTLSPEVDSLAITVSGQGPAVTLAGTVGSYAERLAAHVLAARTPGVEQVENLITVRPYGLNWRMSDEQILLEAAKAVVDTKVHVDQIDLEVERHVVTIRGRVRSNEDRRRLRHAVESASGVEILRNLLEIDEP